MSKYNPAHAHLFGGVIAPASPSSAPLRRSCVVELVRHADVRARFKLDDTAKLELHPTVGERMECVQSWPDGGFTELAVEVYAVHSGGYVDVTGLVIAAEDPPTRITLRRYPNERKASR